MAALSWLELAKGLMGVYLINLIALVVYRLIFHPLAGIPGPKLASTTLWYEIYYDMVHKGRYIFKIQDLHQKYGPIVRIGPNEVHVNDLEFLDTIYAFAPSKRDKERPRNFDIAYSIAGTPEHDIHKIRRNALNPYFSKRAVVAIEPMITEKLQKLEKHLHRFQAESKPVNFADLYFAYSLDVVMNYCFGFDHDVLSDLSRAAEMRQNSAELLLGVKFRSHFGWVLALAKKLPSHLAARFTPKGVFDMMRFSKDIRVQIDQVLASDPKVQSRTVLRDLINDPTLSDAEKSPYRVQQEGAFLILAGTESPLRSLCVIHYYLFANPDILAKVRSELKGVSSPPKVAELEALPYLTGVLAEGNRLSFGLTKRNGRLAVNETLQYGKFSIPPGTLVCATSLSVLANDEVFPEPWKFKPERWIGSNGTQARRYQFAFGKGPRRCLGINLAMAELYLAVAAVAKWELPLFETSEDDVRFQHDYQLGHGKLDSKGVRALVDGKVM